MGLDMYLTKKTYVKNWDHMTAERRHEITVKRGGEIRHDIKPERISEIVEQVAYWRKANAIHKWFVDNVQDGKNECQESCVTVKQLRTLVELCQEVLATVETVDGLVNTGTQYANGLVVELTQPGKVVAQPEIAKKILPTQGGFSFGGTNYDEFYLDDLHDTVKQLEPLLDENGDGYFYYHASW